MTFKVFVDDNYHYRDENERYEKGEYDTFEAAVNVCKSIVDQFLLSAFKPGMSSAELYESYISFGEDPYIIPTPEGWDFSAWDYAKQRCFEIAEPGKGLPPATTTGS